MAMFEPETLQQFDAVVFNNSTALKFENPKHREALLAFVRGGKGIVGVHSATDNFYNWPEAAAMMGALFAGHPWGRCAVKLDDPQHPLLRAFDGKGFWINEEMYKMREPYSRERLRVLLSMDMDKMSAQDVAQGRPDKDNPIAWIQQVGRRPRVLLLARPRPADLLEQDPAAVLFGRHPVRVGRPEGGCHPDRETHPRASPAGTGPLNEALAPNGSGGESCSV